MSSTNRLVSHTSSLSTSTLSPTFTGGLFPPHFAHRMYVCRDILPPHLHEECRRSVCTRFVCVRLRGPNWYLPGCCKYFSRLLFVSFCFSSNCSPPASCVTQLPIPTLTLSPYAPFRLPSLSLSLLLLVDAILELHHPHFPDPHVTPPLDAVPQDAGGGYGTRRCHCDALSFEEQLDVRCRREARGRLFQ